MKRILSLIIALTLVFSLFTVVAVAHAEDGDTSGEEETNARTVTFNAERFKELIFDKHPGTIETKEKFMLDGTITVDEKEVVWYKDSKILHEIFDGINYIELKDADDTQTAEKKVSYAMNYPADVEASDKVEHEDKNYKVTEQVKLEKAPTAKGYKFAGWTFEFADDSAVEAEEMKGEANYFPAEFKFNMPATDVTVKANWIKVAAEGEEQEETPALYTNDLVYILYSSSDPKEEMKEWDRCLVTGTFSVKTISWWYFRFAVVDGIKYAENDNSFDWDYVLATTFDNVKKIIDEKEAAGEKLSPEEEKDILENKDFTLKSFSGDISHPVIKLSSTMENKQEEGLTVGTKYTVSTSLTIEEAGSTTHVTYKVYKLVDGKDTLIFDSSKSTDKVTEGYEENISASGVITPLEEDLDITGDYVYKIVYSVVDDYGFFGVENAELPEGATAYTEFHPEMLLKVKAAPVEPGKITAIEAWKIVLYVVAGLSAVGIVVLLLIKPKKVESTDGRYNSSANETADGSSDGESDQE